MATGTQGEFVAVVNDTDPKSNGKAYSLKISGNNYSQILGKKIGDVVDRGADVLLAGFDLQAVVIVVQLHGREAGVVGY